MRLYSVYKTVGSCHLSSPNTSNTDMFAKASLAIPKNFPFEIKRKTQK